MLQVFIRHNLNLTDYGTIQQTKAQFLTIKWNKRGIKANFELKNGTRERNDYPILFKLKKCLFHSLHPQTWHVMALDQLKCDFSKTGHLWGIFHHNGEEMETFECQSANLQTGNQTLNPTDLKI